MRLEHTILMILSFRALNCRFLLCSINAITVFPASNPGNGIKLMSPTNNELSANNCKKLCHPLTVTDTNPPKLCGFEGAKRYFITLNNSPKVGITSFNPLRISVNVKQFNVKSGHAWMRMKF